MKNPHKITSIITAIAATASALALSACCCQTTTKQTQAAETTAVAAQPAPMPESAKSPVGTGWGLVKLNGEPVVIEGTRPDIRLDPATTSFSGTTSVNRVNGQYVIDGDKITFSRILSTRMASMSAQLNKLESDYLKMLESVTSWRRNSDTLDLYSGETLVATFKAKMQ